MEMTDPKEILEAEARIYSDATAHTATMALRCAVQLDIPDIISNHGRPVTHPELVSLLSIPQAKSSHLYRLMQLLLHSGYFATQKNDQGEQGYVLTTLSRLLLKKREYNYTPMVLFVSDPVVVTPALSAADWLRSPSATPFEAAHGMKIYDYFAKHLHISNMFNEAMACSSQFAIKELEEDLKQALEGFESLVDVGGGNGTIARVINKMAPHLKCSVYDLPHVISNVKDKDGITFIAGDMFESIPSADIILFTCVLIDWSNEECVQILKRCREAISRRGGGKMVLVDSVSNNSTVDTEAMKAKSSFDVFAMSILSGKQRTELEWKEIFVAAGFPSYKINLSPGFYSVIEVFV